MKVGVGAAVRDEKGEPVVDEKGKYVTESELLSVSAEFEDLH